MSQDKRKIIHDEKANGIQLPPEIEAVSFTFGRDMDKIHALDLPVEELPISELMWHLELPFFWLGKDSPFSLKPIDVINNPKLHAYRFNRIMGVNASYPIDVMWWKGRWQILDGLHRFCQQVVLGKSVFNVRKVPPDWADKISPD